MNHQQRKLAIRVVTILVILVVMAFRSGLRPPGPENPDQPTGTNGTVAERDNGSMTAERGTLEITEPPAQQRRPQNPEGADTGAPVLPADEFLTEFQPGYFRSPAGLVYSPGSADGHRLKHILRHLQDDPQKLIHGVFDGSEAAVLMLLDDAYRRMTAGGADVRLETQNGRTAATVFLNRRIGFVGGRNGARDGFPECRYVRLVVENTNVAVTAYPVDSF